MSEPTLDSTAVIVAQALIGLGLGTLPPVGAIAQVNAWPIYPTTEPSVPDNCITVRNTTPQEDGRSMHGGDLWKHYGILIRVRGVDHPTAYAKVFAIAKALNNFQPTGVTVNGNNYTIHCFAKIRGPIDLGLNKPESRRQLFTLNALVVFGFS